MNERIIELAEQARESATTRHPVSNITLCVNRDLFEQKFAELIIKECADVAYSTTLRGGEMAISHIAMPSYVRGKIKQHFGVE